ncbi:MAG: RNA recognition motif domain-containing protein [Puniceicoccaceae bacterium]
MDIYVGNLAYEVRDDELNEAFAQFGEIESARVIMDRETGRSRGFGFVKMPNREEGQRAIEELNDSDFQGRPMRVREAEERQPRGGGGGGFNRGGGGGGFNRGGGGGGFNRGGGGRGGRDGGRRGGYRD